VGSGGGGGGLFWGWWGGGWVWCGVGRVGGVGGGALLLGGFVVGWVFFFVGGVGFALVGVGVESREIESNTQTNRTGKINQSKENKEEPHSV